MTQEKKSDEKPGEPERPRKEHPKARRRREKAERCAAAMALAKLTGADKRIDGRNVQSGVASHRAMRDFVERKRTGAALAAAAPQRLARPSDDNVGYGDPRRYGRDENLVRQLNAEAEAKKAEADLLDPDPPHTPDDPFKKARK